MSVQHHLDDATLVRFAAGELDEAFSVVVATHLAMCDKCTKALRLAEEMGGAMMHDVDTVDVTLAPNALARALEGCLSPSPDHAPRIASAKPAHNAVPKPLMHYVDTDLDDVPWKMAAPGIYRHVLSPKSDTESSLYMLKIAPGKKMPEHGHGGGEITLILKGAYTDSLGRFGPGDVADLDEHLEHQPVAEPGEACICLVATEAPTKFKSRIDRFFQPFVGI